MLIVYIFRRRTRGEFLRERTEPEKRERFRYVLYFAEDRVTRK